MFYCSYSHYFIGQTLEKDEGAKWSPIEDSLLWGLLKEHQS